MTTVRPFRRGSLCFCFADAKGFSGQKAATELVLNGLRRRGWDCQKLPQPVFDRAGGGLLAWIGYVARLLAAWMRSVRLLGGRGAWLWIGLGQTRFAFVRDGVPLLFGRLGLGRSRVVVALNGSLFMQWPLDSLEARVFRFLLHHVGTVAVVGENQRARVQAFGVSGLRVEVVVNSCELEIASSAGVAAKQQVAAPPHDAIRCLYLSSLIDTKGFPEYLEALLRLSKIDGPKIQAILCGQLVASEFSERFRDNPSAEEWILRTIADINRGSRVCVSWINGAAGADKAALFRWAQIFVLPTRYPVEAQPLALLEAMASGCAIITTRAGEISTILNDACAVLLSAPSTDVLASGLQTLAADTVTRARLAFAAHARFVEFYQVERHLDQWETLLKFDDTTCKGAK